MELYSLIGHSSQLLTLILKSAKPSDKIASFYFRGKKYLGSKDRKFISQAVFASLRYLSLLKHCIKHIYVIHPIQSTKVDYFPVICGLYYLSTICKLPINSSSSNKLNYLILNDSIDNTILSDALAKRLDINVSQAFSLLETIKTKYDILSKECFALTDKWEDFNEQLTNDDITLLSVYYSLPQWILAGWINNKKRFSSHTNPLKIAKSLCHSAPVCLRINRNISRDKVIRELANSGINAAPGNLSPSCIVLNNRPQLSVLPVYKQGVIEVQEEGSQIISYALGPKPNWKILDACAGAGGKSLHLASLQNDMGEIIATDIEVKKLKELLKRSNRAGFRSIKTFQFDHSKQKNIPEYIRDYIRKDRFDAVLVDAPCSGTGTSRRSPMHKWRLTPKMLSRLVAKQKQILKNASSFLKPGGILVYATCSLMFEENEDIIDNFLNNNPSFIPDPLGPVFTSFNVNIKDFDNNSHTLSLNPDLHGCDGFFVARMKKKY